MRVVVDGMNVIGSRPDGWWRDRPAAMRGLVRSLRDLADASGDDITVVLDARPFEVGDPGAVSVRFAPGGRNAADDEIVRMLESGEAPGAVVVTSDRELADRVRALGAAVRPARELRTEIDRYEPG